MNINIPDVGHIYIAEPVGSILKKFVINMSMCQVLDKAAYTYGGSFPYYCSSFITSAWSAYDAIKRPAQADADPNIVAGPPIDLIPM